MAFAVGDLLVHDHAVKAFLGRFGKQLFRDRNVFLGGETEAVNEPLHLGLGFFDALANLDFLFAGEQGHLAHLIHVHPNRIIQHFQPAVFPSSSGSAGLARSTSAWSTISMSRPRSLV